MKKIIPIVLSSLLILTVAGCTTTDNSVPSNDPIPSPEISTIPQPEPVPVSTKEISIKDNLIYRNDTYGYEITLPEEFGENYEVKEDIEGITDFVVKGSTDPFMTIVSSSEEDIDFSLSYMEFLGLKDGITTYKMMPTCGTLNNENDREIWDKLSQASQNITSDNFSYIDGEGVIPEKPIILEGLAKILHDSRNSEDNEYYDITTPTNTNDMVIELMGLKDVEISDYAISASLMNVHAYGIAIVKTEDTQLASDGLQSYIDLMKANFEYYLVEQYDIASNAVLEISGDYVVMVMCDNAKDVSQNILNALKEL